MRSSWLYDSERAVLPDNATLSTRCKKCVKEGEAHSFILRITVPFGLCEKLK